MATRTPQLAAQKAEKQHDFYHLTSSSHFRVCLLLAPPPLYIFGVPNQKEGLTILTLYLKFQFLSSSPRKGVKCKAQLSVAHVELKTDSDVKVTTQGLCSHTDPGLVGIPYLLSCTMLSIGGIFSVCPSFPGAFRKRIDTDHQKREPPYLL